MLDPRFSALNDIDGNVMAWLADQQINEEYEEEEYA